MTIVKIFSEVVDQQPDKIAFQFENEKWTFKQVKKTNASIIKIFYYNFIDIILVFRLRSIVTR